jgi:hypothetical protein
MVKKGWFIGEFHVNEFTGVLSKHGEYKPFNE